MKIDLTTTKNVKLKTAGKYAEEDIEVVSTLQTKQVRPTEESQVVTVDSGFSGIGEVQVDAIPNTYIGSAVPRKGEETYTPTTTDQEIGLGQFLSGKQVIKGDSNLVAENIARGQTIFGVTGTHEGGVTPSGTINITENGTHNVELYANAEVDVQPSLQEKTATENGEVTADSGYYGLSKVIVDVPSEEPVLITKEITENGDYNASDDNADGYSSVSVNVASGGGSSNPHPELPYGEFINPDWYDIKTILDNDTNEGVPSGYGTKKVILLFEAVQSFVSIGYISGRTYYRTSDGLFSSVDVGIGRSISFDGSGDKPYYDKFGNIIGYTRYVIVYLPDNTDGSFTTQSPTQSYQYLKYFECNYTPAFSSGTYRLTPNKMPLLEIMQYNFYSVTLCDSSGSATNLRYLAPQSTAINGVWYGTNSIIYSCPLQTIDFLKHTPTALVSLNKNEALRCVKNLDLTNGVSVGLTYCKNLRVLDVKNVKANLTIASGSTWGHLIVKDNLISIISELIDTGAEKKLTMGVINLAKISETYVKLLEDDGSGKLPFEVCESSDEGAMLITDYVGLKNWAIA